MRTLLQSSFIIVLFVAVRAADLAISAAIARATIRALAYGIVGLLAIIAVVMSLFGL